MEQLPAEIEQKIENLPIVQFSSSEDFQAVILSNEFTDFSLESILDLPAILPDLMERLHV